MIWSLLFFLAAVRAAGPPNLDELVVPLEDTNGVERHYELSPATEEELSATNRLHRSFPLTVDSPLTSATGSAARTRKSGLTSTRDYSRTYHRLRSVLDKLEEGTSHASNLESRAGKSRLESITRGMQLMAGTQRSLIDQLHVLQDIIHQQHQALVAVSSTSSSTSRKLTPIQTAEKPSPTQVNQDSHDLDIAEAQLVVAREFVASLSRRGFSPMLVQQENNIRSAEAQLAHARQLLKAHINQPPRTEQAATRAETALDLSSGKQMLQGLMSKLGLVDTKNPLPVYYKKQFNDPTYPNPQDDQVAYAPTNLLNKTGNFFPENFLKWNPASLNVDSELKKADTMPAPPPPMPPEYPLAYPPFREHGRQTVLASLPSSPVEGFSTVVPNSGWESLISDSTGPDAIQTFASRTTKDES